METTMQPEIQTERLRLVALTLAQLDLSLADPERLERELDVSLSPDLLDKPARRAIGYKTKRMPVTATALHPWLTFWLVVLTAERYGVGLVGFKGDPDESDEVEIGYGIVPAYRRQGIATEAVKALIGWAFQDPACGTIRADTLKGNIASGRVLAKAGMSVYHETDEGLCWKIERGNASSP
jgi:RimJ/RimL family protein N-acetyltransferase